MKPVPIFIFSLQRSGSTLLQRVLAAHSRIATVTEPWILLPMMYGLRKNGMAAEYGHGLYVDALTDIIKALPGERASYFALVHDYAVTLYEKVSPKGAHYFVDKTPRYALIVDEILEAFPEGKFIFLWRNPLSVVASTLETWNDGRWNLSGHKLDFYRCMANLVHAFKTTQRNVISLRYEDLTARPQEELGRLLSYLDLDMEPGILTDFNDIDLRGHHGDHTGRMVYQKISTDSHKKWRASICNPLRKIWARRYLDWIGRDRLQAMGYDLANLKDDLTACPVSHRLMVSDVMRMMYGEFRCCFQTTLIWQNVACHESLYDIVNYS